MILNIIINCHFILTIYSILFNVFGKKKKRYNLKYITFFFFLPRNHLFLFLFF